MIVPPKKSNGIDRYETTVDNSQKPSIFVTYYDDRAYPEYIITVASNGSNYISSGGTGNTGGSAALKGARIGSGHASLPAYAATGFTTKTATNAHSSAIKTNSNATHTHSSAINVPGSATNVPGGATASAENSKYCNIL